VILKRNNKVTKMLKPKKRQKKQQQSKQKRKTTTKMMTKRKKSQDLTASFPLNIRLSILTQSTCKMLGKVTKTPSRATKCKKK
jgi:hypothetical protein